MTESTVENVPATPVATSPKKKKATPSKAKVAVKKASTHPATAVMVNSAIKTLNERGGSSLQAIKKSVSGTYKLDAEKLAPFIKKYLKSAVEKGTLIRTKGKGAAGSFKLAPKTDPKIKKAVVPKKKTAPPKKEKTEKVESKPKKTVAKVAPKKPAATVKKASQSKTVSKPTPTTPKKTPSKVKKTKVAPTKKPKSPKPKKAAIKKAPKKTVSKK